WCRRNPALASLMTVVLLLAIVGASVGTGLVVESARRAEAEGLRSDAEEQKTRAERAQQLAEANVAKAESERQKARSAQEKEAEARKKAEENEGKAQTERQKAEAARREAAQVRYARQLEVAWQEWEKGNVGRASQLLWEARPQALLADGKSLGFEW